MRVTDRGNVISLIENEEGEGDTEGKEGDGGTVPLDKYVGSR